MSSTFQQVSKNNDVINVHFDANRKRQGLTNYSISTTDSKEVISVGGGVDTVDDKSRKGSIDTRIVKLVNQINNINISQSPTLTSSSTITKISGSTNTTTSDESCPSPSPSSQATADTDHTDTKVWNYFTTSSCSGRAILFTHDDDQQGEKVVTTTTEEDESPKEQMEPPQVEHVASTASNNEEQLVSPQLQLRKTNQKKGCKWLYVTHDEINTDEFMTCWRNLAEGTYAVFKIEPSIFHIQCRTLASARELIQVAATQSGFRNSGMVIGKDGKITVAVRSTIGLEVPLPVGRTPDGNPIVSDQFLEYLINTGNDTLRQNWIRTEKFEHEFQKHFFYLRQNEYI